MEQSDEINKTEGDDTPDPAAEPEIEPAPAVSGLRVSIDLDLDLRLDLCLGGIPTRAGGAKRECRALLGDIWRTLAN